VIPILTRARQSVWDAIENWPTLAGEFKRTWKFDDPGGVAAEPVPTMGELPALAIYPSEPTASDWIVNQAQLVPYKLRAQLWTRHWRLETGERLWQEITQALFRCAAPGQPSYVLRGTGYNGIDLGPLSARRARLADNGPHCTVWEWTIGLRIAWNPGSSAESG
jgi:hypothetical protein